ncbi:MAG: hypothetical protein IMY72_00705 [Bacteroidetes bacterium]|nr:hypothetical protein [Bacteroidota bacterium]
MKKSINNKLKKSTKLISGLGILVIMLLNFNSFAQQTVGTHQQIEHFFKTKTYIVLENNPLLEYNGIIKETVKNHWDLTDYEFVTFGKNEFERVRMDTAFSFVIFHKLYFNKDKTRAQYNFLSLELGGDYKFIKQMPDLCSIPVSYVDVEEDVYNYKMGLIIRFLQSHIKLTREHPELKSSNIIKYYNKNTSNIHNKTLYVTKNDLSKDVNTLAKIKKIYPYKVKIATRDEIKQVVDSHDKNAVILHKVGPEHSKRKARCYNSILGADDAKLYYFSYHMISDKKPEGLLAKDFKKMAKAK